MNTKTKGLSCNFSIVGYLLWQVDDCLFRDDDENEFPIYALNPVSINKYKLFQTENQAIKVMEELNEHIEDKCDQWVVKLINFNFVIA